MNTQWSMIRDLAEFQAVKDEWNSLAPEHPFFNWEWMFSWWEAFGVQFESRILVAKDNLGNWLGIAPFFVEKTKTGARHLRLISSGKACADYHGLICKPEKHDWFALQVSKWLKGELAGIDSPEPFDLVDLEGIDASTRQHGAWIEQFKQDGFSLHRTNMENCWVAKLETSWDEFNAGLSKSFRRKTKKAVQKLADDTTRVLTSQSAEEFEPAWAEFVELHQKRRNMLAQEGCFAEDAFESFLKKAVSRLMARKAAAIIRVHYDGTAFAAGLLLLNQTHAYMYQSGIDPERINLEPGHVLNTAMIQYAIDQGKTHFDFLRGDEPYKARWGANALALSRLRLVPNRLSSKLRHKIWETGRAVKNWASASAWFNPQ